ncbi:hypothetical protein HED60_21040 [Planctomycetales bacterium ZRK34]|nr:hypothetical protein HED60_21040 [Planctomycetales bacterium ZRK34]
MFNRSFARRMLMVLVAVMTFGVGAAAYAQHQGETEAQHAARMAWWRNAKFGMFIHWGVYSVPAGTYDGKQIGGIGEWIMNRGKIPCDVYQKYAKDFVPSKYDPDAWAQLAADAGMKYMVITSKHHDGFALFPSDVTKWDIADASPYGKDLIGPLAKAARAQGLKFGLYYSQAQDWNHPGGAASGGHWDTAQDGDMDRYLKEIAVPQVREILTRYKPDILWWDTPTNMSKERAELFMPLFKDQPDIITNNRLGGGYRGDTETPEQHIPATGYKDRDWEVCMTMNDTWGYKSYDHNWKSTADLLHKLCDIVSKGGNFLLNIGPRPDGTIPQESIDRLHEVGKWMNVNSESIYGTTASPFASKLTWGRVTKKLRPGGATLYMQIFDWPADHVALLPGLKNKVTSAKLLAGGATVKTENTPDGVVVHLPGEATDPIVSVVKLEVEGDLDVAKVLPKQKADGTMVLNPVQADIHNVFGSDAKVETIAHEPSIGFWTDKRVKVSYKFHIDKPGTFKVNTQIAGTGDSKFTISVGDQKLSVATEKTGDFRKFKPVTLGQVTLDKAGDYTLTITPDGKAWGPINMRTITLVPAESESARDARMKWWRDDRFGMFIHWGLYAVPAGEYNGKDIGGIGEWIMNHAPIPADEYQKYTKQFDPAKYDPEKWVKAAADAGVKYLVITSKHHDGFCLWDSKVTKYDIVDATPYGKDLLKPLAEACKKHGIKFCTYYSIMDWHHPSQTAGGKNGRYNPTKIVDGRKEEYVKYMKAQLKELIDNYDVEVMWFDGEWVGWWTEPDGKDLYAYLRKLKPSLIINNRIGKGRKGMEGLNKGDQEYAGDFGTPEQQIPADGLPGVDWESCMTMNDTWGFKKKDHNWKSSEKLIRNLIDICSKGGNYLLNVGPTAEGEIPGPSLERLADMGKWMKVNGQSLYGTTASPFPKQPKWGRVTTKGSTLYLHVFEWPADGKLTMPAVDGKVKSVKLLADPSRSGLSASVEGGQTVVTLAGSAPDKIASVVELQLSK